MASKQEAPGPVQAEVDPIEAPALEDPARAEYEERAKQREEARAAMNPPMPVSPDESPAANSVDPVAQPDPQAKPAKEAEAKSAPEITEPPTRRKNLLERAREAQRKKKDLAKPSSSPKRTQG